MFKKIINCLLAPVRALYNAAKAAYYKAKAVWNFSTTNHSAYESDSDNNNDEGFIGSSERLKEILKNMKVDIDTQIAGQTPPINIKKPASRKSLSSAHSYDGYQIKNNNIEVTACEDEDDRLSFRSR